MNTKEIFEDIATVKNSYDNNEKKSIAAKYGISSRKKDEIINFLYKKLVEIRRSENRTDFTTEDIRAFNHTYSIGTTKKAAEAFECESVEFIDFMRQSYEHLWKKYGNSYAGKSYFRTMQIIEKVLYNKKNEKSIKKNEENIDGIFNTLLDLTASFRKMQCETILKSEETNFNIMKNEDPKILKENKQFNILRLYNYISVKSDKFKDLQKYLDYVNEDFQKTFDNNLKAVAERLNQHNLKSENNIEIKLIGEDPKFIELIIKTDIGTFNCRSILAAIDSYYMRAHHRFIITKM